MCSTRFRDRDILCTTNYNTIKIKIIYLISNPFKLNLNPSSKSEYEVCSLSSEYSFA